MPDRGLQSPQPLDIFGVVDDVGHRRDVAVPALQHVVVSLVACTGQHVPAPLDTGPEQVGGAGDAGGQLRHLYAQAHTPGQRFDDIITGIRSEVREVALAVVDRRVAVQHPGLVHHGEDLVVDAAEFRHGRMDPVLVQVGVLFPEFMQQGHGLLVGDVATGLPFRQLLQPVADEFQLADVLDGVGLAHLVAGPHSGLDLQRLDPLVVPIHHAVLLRLVLADGVDIGADQSIRLSSILGEILEDTAPGLTAVGKEVLLVLPLVAVLDQLLGLVDVAFTPRPVVFLHRRRRFPGRLLRFVGPFHLALVHRLVVAAAPQFV